MKKRKLTIPSRTHTHPWGVTLARNLRVAARLEQFRCETYDFGYSNGLRDGAFSERNKPKVRTASLEDLQQGIMRATNLSELGKFNRTISALSPGFQKGRIKGLYDNKRDELMSQVTRRPSPAEVFAGIVIRDPTEPPRSNPRFRNARTNALPTSAQIAERRRPLSEMVDITIVPDDHPKGGCDNVLCGYLPECAGNDKALRNGQAHQSRKERDNADDTMDQRFKLLELD